LAASFCSEMILFIRAAKVRGKGEEDILLRRNFGKDEGSRRRKIGEERRKR
jgi:hypothetical protein